MSEKVSLTPNERFEFFKYNIHKDDIWLLDKLHVDIRTLRRYKAKLRKLTKEAEKDKLPDDDVPDDIDPFYELAVPDSITLSYVEKKALLSRNRDHIDQCKLLLDILYKRKKIDGHADNPLLTEDDY